MDYVNIIIGNGKFVITHAYKPWLSVPQVGLPGNLHLTRADCICLG